MTDNRVVVAVGPGCGCALIAVGAVLVIGAIGAIAQFALWAAAVVAALWVAVILLAVIPGSLRDASETRAGAWAALAVWYGLLAVLVGAVIAAVGAAS